MVSYFVRYRGAASDPEGFRRYYEAQHAPILGRFPSIRSLVLHSPGAWTDPFPVRRADTFLLAQMVFDSASDLDTALRSPVRAALASEASGQRGTPSRVRAPDARPEPGSPARAQARDDFQRFPPFDGEATHEAMAGKVIF